MDSRDSSPSGSEEDNIISLTCTLAKDSSMLFQSRKFAECVDVLNQISRKKQDDPKVLHNIAIAEYFRDGCSDQKKVLAVLNSIQQRGEELARTSGEQEDAAGTTGNKIIFGLKGNNIFTQQLSTTNNASIVFTHEFDMSVVTLNIATIWFHLQEYPKALSVLEPLYQNIEPIDETTALHVCLLLVDVALLSQDASRSADVISYLERAFGVLSQARSGSTTQHHSSNIVTKSSAAQSNTCDASNTDSTANLNLENSLSRTLSEDAIEYDALLSTLDVGGQNITRTPGVSSSSDLSKPLIDRSDLKLKLQLYKVRLLLLTRNIKAAKREMKIAMNIARGSDSSTTLLLKAQLEYARGNYRKSFKLLMASNNRTETWTSSIFNNNLGCIHYKLGKSHTSTIFFSKALTNIRSFRKDKPLNLLTFSHDKSLLILYNCGVQYLACGKPLLSANCFQKASLVFYDKPLLWLRIAECCLMASEKGLFKSGGRDKPEIKAHVIGSGKLRKIVVEDKFKNGNLNSVQKDDCFVLSMPLARNCLVNALHLLNSESKKKKSTLICKSKPENDSSVNGNCDVRDHKGLLTLNVTLQNSISEYEETCKRENNVVKQAILANLSYVELELENPIKALSTAKSLLNLPECSKLYVFLAHVYAAEALCLLNRIKEASEHLSAYLSGENEVELPFTQHDHEQWPVQKILDSEETAGKNLPNEENQGIVFPKPEEARGTLFVNLAVLCAFQGDFEQAKRFTDQALLALPNSPKACISAVYVDLMLGRTKEALAKLKSSTQVTFLHNTFGLKGSY